MMNRKSRLHNFARTRLREERGQALVELALTMPLLLLFLLGAVEFGQLAYMSIELANASKAAAQYGAQTETTARDSAGMGLVATRDAPYTNANCTGFTTTVTEPPRCVFVSAGSVSAPSTAACTQTGGYHVQVLEIQTSATCRSIFHIAGLPGSYTLHGSAVQEVLN